MDKKTLIQITDELYRLTLLFPKKESLRYKLREQANEILMDSIYLLREIETNSQAVEKSALAGIWHKDSKAFAVLDSFLEIARLQNWVSSNKISLIKEKYLTMMNMIEEMIKKEREKEPEKLAMPQKEPIFLEQEAVSSVPILTKTEKLNERQKTILETLKEKEKAQVWHFKKIFPEVSKRTLRRDFEQLYTRGLVERIGERNNTFYRLAGIGQSDNDRTGAALS